MSVKTILMAVLLVGVLIVGCESKTTSYATYNQPKGGQQPNGQYVGGGCGVAPSGDYKDTPTEALNPISSSL